MGVLGPDTPSKDAKPTGVNPDDVFGVDEHIAEQEAEKARRESPEAKAAAEAATEAGIRKIIEAEQANRADRIKKFSKPKELEVGADPSEYIEGFLAKQDAAAACRESPEGKAAQKAADEALYDQLLSNERKRWKEAEEREKNRNQCSAEDLMAAE